MYSVLTLIILFASTTLALFLGSQFPLLGNSISAILIGAIIRHTPLFDRLDKKITGFVSKYILKTGIVLLGFTLSLRILGEVGAQVLIILCAVVLTSLSMSYFANRLFNIEPKLSALIGIGTSICGGSAISATAPIIEAEDNDMAISITTMLIYSMVALFVLPVIGKALGFTDAMYGVLAGASVNDVASVVATSFEWSDEAGAIATITKLTRTLFLVPLTIGVILMRIRQASLEHKTNPAVKLDAQSIVKLVPVFVVLFVLAVIFATVIPIPEGALAIINTSSKLLMTLALVSIGLGVHLNQIKKAGLKPVFIGGMCWGSVVLVSVVLIKLLYT
ncbi:putative sulfate exporter family transporter [Aerococcaceae bacterium DSM 111020]|nr:putative sulfate exporter family transporter [Aerococcaceae bacterium DSM 111020]